MFLCLCLLLALIDFRSLLALSPAQCEPVSLAPSLLLPRPLSLTPSPSLHHSISLSLTLSWQFGEGGLLGGNMTLLCACWSCQSVDNCVPSELRRRKLSLSLAGRYPLGAVWLHRSLAWKVSQENGCLSTRGRASCHLFPRTLFISI